MSLIKRRKSSLDQRVNDLLLRLKPRTQLDDLEDWIDQYGASGIVHDMMLIATGKSAKDQGWLKVAVALAECFMAIERINYDTSKSERANIKGR